MYMIPDVALDDGCQIGTCHWVLISDKVSVNLNRFSIPPKYKQTKNKLYKVVDRQENQHGFMVRVGVLYLPLHVQLPHDRAYLTSISQSMSLQHFHSLTKCPSRRRIPLPWSHQQTPNNHACLVIRIPLSFSFGLGAGTYDVLTDKGR